MSQVTGQVETWGPTSLVGSIVGSIVGVVGLGLRRLLRWAGFWSAVVLPVVALVLLVVQPAGWGSLLVAVVVANGIGALVGHCYGLEC